MKTRSNKVKVTIVMSFAVVFAALSDISLSMGMKKIGNTDFPTLYDAFIAAVSNPHIWTGILLLIVFLVLYLVSLSWEDLSFVLPLTAGIYVLVTLFAHFLLHENISLLRWAGTLLVAGGIALVTRS